MYVQNRKIKALENRINAIDLERYEEKKQTKGHLHCTKHNKDIIYLLDCLECKDMEKPKCPAQDMRPCVHQKSDNT